jgi:double-stranded uracil-DNA glycosylase
MSRCIGFNYVARSDARVLILGSLPGVESLKQNQYYAKKQNSFWRIMGALIQAGPELEYEERLVRLIQRHVALWDVCKEALREGSLDSNIVRPQPNDFETFFAKHTNLELICFNGQPAAKLFWRYVDGACAKGLPIKILPSTSPAYAGMKVAEKEALWREALMPIVGRADVQKTPSL